MVDRFKAGEWRGQGFRSFLQSLRTSNQVNNGFFQILFNELFIIIQTVAVSGGVSKQNMLATKGKAIPVADRGGPQGCETSRLSHFLDSRFTDRGEVVSLTRQQAALYPQEDSWYSFMIEAAFTPGTSFCFF
jgi:hypothetical protein